MWAVIPVKNISQAKQRLSPSLKEEERKHLFSAMLEDVLSVVVKIHFFEKIILATNCQNAISIAKSYGVSVLTTGPDRGLNQAAIESVNFLEGKGVEGMFLIPADIPLVTDKEIYSVLDSHPPSPSVSIFLPKTSPDQIVWYLRHLTSCHLGLGRKVLFATKRLLKKEA